MLTPNQVNKVVFIIMLLMITNSNANTITVGYFSAFPYIMHVPNSIKPEGVIVDIWEELAKQSEYQIKWINMPHARIIKELDSKNIVAGAVFIPSAERNARFIFPTSHWDIVVPSVAISRHIITTNGITKDQLKGKTIGYLGNSIITPWIQNIELKFSYIFGSNGLSRLATQLHYKRIDGIYWPSKKMLELELAFRNLSKDYQVLATPETGYPIKPMFAKTALGQKLSDDFDNRMSLVKVNYKVEKAKQRFLSERVMSEKYIQVNQ